jgi:hypothetical protein
MINFIKKIFCIFREHPDKKRRTDSREATEDELKNESMSSNEIKLFEICGDSVLYHCANANSIMTYTKREFKNFSWFIVKFSVEINGVMYHYKLMNQYMGSISICFYTKENAEKQLKAILQFTKDNIPQAHCYCEKLINK